jgi:hypothetical protein
MPEETRLHNPKKAMHLIESILRLEYKMKDPSLSDNERKSLKENYLSLVSKASIELKGIDRSIQGKIEEFQSLKPNNHNFTLGEEQKYFREPYISYYEELAREWENLANIKKGRIHKAKKKRIKEKFEFPIGTDDDIKTTFRLLKKNSLKPMIRTLFLDQLKFTDKEEDDERSVRIIMELFYTYLISQFISLKFDLIKTAEEWIQKLIQQELEKKELLIEHHERFNLILDKIINISLQLNNEDLAEEQRSRERQERENYRRALKALKKDLMEKVTKHGINLKDELEKFGIKKDHLLIVIRKYEEHLKRKRDFKH